VSGSAAQDTIFMYLRLMKWGLLINIIVLFALQACKVSLSGIAIPDAASSVSVELFESNAALCPPAYPQQITEALRDKFLSTTRLNVVSAGGDLQFRANIVNYTINPSAVGGNETAALTRLTVAIMLEYENSIEPDKNFKRGFSRFADFDASQPLSAVESSLLLEITDQLIQDIFNQAFLDW
jgi:hypothetical protein